MPRMRHLRDRAAATLLTAASIALCAGGMSSCKSGASGSSNGHGSIAGSGDRRPADARAMNAPPPPGLDPASVKLIPESDPKARLPLEKALAEVAKAAPQPSASSAARAATGERGAEALRLYASARMKRLQGEPAEAIKDLSAAAKLDPASADIWRELGEAQLAKGNRPAASAAFERAFERDPDDTRSLEQMARIATERREFEKAAALTAMLMDRHLQQVDPALPFLAWSQMSRALAALGYTAASAEAAAKANELPDRFAQPTDRGPELANLYRQRGESWRDIGDARLRLGMYAEALDAYEHARLLPSLNPSAIVSRRVYAAMKLGHPELAAQTLGEEMAIARGRFDDPALALVAYVHEWSGSGRADMRQIIDGVEQSLGPRDRALAAGSLARARAACSDPSKAMAILRARLAEAPTDDAALGDLLARLRRAPMSELISQTVALVEAAPLDEQRYGVALLSEMSARRPATGAAQPATGAADSGDAESSAPPSEIPPGWGQASASVRSSPAGMLLHARLLALSARPEEAQADFAALQSDPKYGPAAIIARASILSSLGRFDVADKLLDSISLRGDALRFAKATVLAERGRDEEGLAILSELLKQPTLDGVDRADASVRAAMFAVNLGQYQQAEEYFKAALAADPAREDAYAGLISLYAPAPDGKLPNEARLFETVRAMREAVPSGRTLRWLRARESIQRGQLDMAERDLVDLAEEYPTQPEVVELLVTLWLTTGSADQAQTWLKAKLERFPDASILEIKLADAMCDSRKAPEAAAMLQAWLDRSPGDWAVSRKLEAICRTKLNDPERADALARKRIAASPRTPETLLEEADLYLRTERVDAAVEVLEDLLSRFPNLTLGKEQAAKVGDVVVRTCQKAIDASAVTKSTVELVNRLMKVAPAAPIQAHILRLAVAAGSGFNSAKEIIAFATQAVQQYPTYGEQLFQTAIDGSITRLRTRAQMGDLLDRALEGAGIRRALEIAEAAPDVLGKSTLNILDEWIRLTVYLSNADSLMKAISRARLDGLFDQLVARLGGDDGGGAPAARGGGVANIDTARATGAYRLGNDLIALGREAEGMEMYRTALRYDPKHPGTNNDLGYRLLLQGEKIEEAAAMIEIAAKADPDNGSYIDSLGWARYKLGIIHSDLVPGTNEPRQGAVALLTKALDLMNRRDADSEYSSPVVIDHLGDASWAAGERETAVRHWSVASKEAARLIEDDVKAAGNNPRGRGTMTASLRQELEQVRDNGRKKIEAATNDKDPPVSPILRPINVPREPAP